MSIFGAASMDKIWIESGSPVPPKEALILAFWLVQTLDNVRISIQPLLKQKEGQRGGGK